MGSVDCIVTVGHNTAFFVFQKCAINIVSTILNHG